METKEMIFYGALLAGGGLALYYFFLRPKPATEAAYLQPSTKPSFTTQPQVPAAQQPTPAVTYKDEHFSVALPLDKMWNWAAGLFKSGEPTTKEGISKTIQSLPQTSQINPVGIKPSMTS